MPKKFNLKNIFNRFNANEKKDHYRCRPPNRSCLLSNAFLFHRQAYVLGNKKLQDARLENERTMLSRHIEATDGAIDKLVYELYGLTEEEIVIVEGSGK